MSYYVLPKNNNPININPHFSSTITPFMSHSLIHYLKQQYGQYVYNEEVNKSVNHYEFIFTKVPGYKFSVSKLRPPSEEFYVLMELSHIFNLFDSFNKKDITSMHFTPCPESTIDCLDMLREEKQDVHLSNSSVKDLYNILTENQTHIHKEHSIEFMYFGFPPVDELCTYYDDLFLKIKMQSYFNNLIAILLNILIYQAKSGISVIKIGNIFHKFLLDIIFIFTGLFDKVYIIKPNTSNILNNERYIVCKFFHCRGDNNNYLENLKRLLIQKILIIEDNGLCLDSLIDNELPYYFLNKVEESNIIIGQQQLEAFDLAINVIKNKNKDEKLETMKKNNIQKCIQMCEKFKIPYNKFSDKVNIFLQSHNVEENGLSHNSFLGHNHHNDSVDILSNNSVNDNNAVIIDSDMGLDNCKLI
jgi:hypothetical protein